MLYVNSETTTPNQYNFLTIVEEIIRNPFYTNSEKTVFVDLLYCNSFGRAFPSQETLASRHGYKQTKSIRTILKSLERKTGLTWKKRGYSMSNLYTMDVTPFLYVPKSVNTSLLGTTVPIQKGTQIPPNINTEYEINNNNEVFSLYKLKSGQVLNRNKTQELEELIDTYGSVKVLEVINIASKQTASFSPSYLKAIILNKSKDYKETQGASKFIPCAKCGTEDGFLGFTKDIDGYDTPQFCECKKRYDNKKRLEKEPLKSV